jgi:hypothetical protein
MPEITVWTKQNEAVLDQLGAKGRFTADPRYIRRELEDTADTMLYIYRWLAEHMPADPLSSRSGEFNYPVWVTFVRDAVMMPEPGYVILGLRLDSSQITAIDIIKWTKITNYSYIPADEADEREHNEMLRLMGIDNARAVMTGFYPEVRDKVIRSWDRLFEPPASPGPGSYGLIREVRKEWIQQIIR